MHVYQSCVIIFPFSAAAFYFYGLLSFCPSILFPWPKELVYFTVFIHIILPLQVTVSTTFLVFCPNTCPNCLEHEIAILCFAFDYVQPLREAPLQSIQSPQKILRTIPVYKRSSYHELTPWGVSKRKWDTKEDKGRSMMRALYVLWYVKRHLLG